MATNCLAYVCGTNTIAARTAESRGWSIWCKNNKEKETLSWAHLACAVVYLTTVPTGKRNTADIYYAKAAVIQTGRDLLRKLADRTDGDHNSGLNADPQADDILICGTTTDPHFVKYVVTPENQQYMGQPAVIDESFPAAVKAPKLEQELTAGGKKSYNIRGYFR